MENTKKIVFIFLLIITFFFSCKKTTLKEEQKIVIKDPSLVDKDSTGKYIITISRPIGIQKINKVYSPKHKMTYNVSDSIDFSTFQKIEVTPEYQNKVNIYYKKRIGRYYYVDKKYIYIYIDNEFNIHLNKKFKTRKHPFFIAGSSNDFEVLGGNYIRIGNKIYCSGIEIKNVISENFTTIDLLRRHSEWDFSIGTDGKYLYTCGGKVFTKESLLHNYHVDKSILKKYFGETKSKN